MDNSVLPAGDRFLLGHLELAIMRFYGTLGSRSSSQFWPVRCSVFSGRTMWFTTSRVGTAEKSVAARRQFGIEQPKLALSLVRLFIWSNAFGYSANVQGTKIET
jgi:hypothetical protein